MYRFLSVFFILLIASSLSIQAQKGEVPEDEKADQLVQLGRRYLRTENYLDAALTFELATQRPFNQATTSAIYFTGLSYFRLGEREKASKRFKQLLADYPATSYKEDVYYHLAIIKMDSESRNEQEQGLDQLISLLESTSSNKLKGDIQTTLRYYLFEVYDKNFVDLYYLFVDEEYKPLLMEAIVYKLDRENRGFDALERIKEHEEKGYLVSKYLFKMRQKYENGKTLKVNVVNIAVFLSMHLELSDTARGVPKDSERGFEIYYGMKMALDSLGDRIGKRVNLKFFDTRGDTAQTRMLLASLDEFGPDIILGEIRTSVNLMIGKWAEERQVMHMVIQNPFRELMEQKQHVFLLHPSLENEAEALANFIVKTQLKRKILVFSTPDFFSNRYATSFIAAVDSMHDPNIMVVRKDIPKMFSESNYKPLLSYIRGLKSAGYEAIYLPLRSEEWAGFIMSELNAYKIETQVYGAAFWEGFEAIDPELKSYYELIYTTNFYKDNDSTNYAKFEELCLKDHCYTPSENLMVGYDVMMYLLRQLESYNGQLPLVQYFETAKPWKGLHQEIFFGDSHANRAVNILRFKDGKTEKLNVYYPIEGNNELEGTVPEGVRPDSGWR